MISYGSRIKATFDIDGQLLHDACTEAHRRGLTLSGLVEDALRAVLREMEQEALPTFGGGCELVDVADREALFEVFDTGHIRPGLD